MSIKIIKNPIIKSKIIIRNNINKIINNNIIKKYDNNGIDKA